MVQWQSSIENWNENHIWKKKKFEKCLRKSAFSEYIGVKTNLLTTEIYRAVNKLWNSQKKKIKFHQ